MGTAIKHPVLARPGYAIICIFDIRAL